MARRAHPVRLSDDDVAVLTQILRRGDTPAKARNRAWVLTLLHGGQRLPQSWATVGMSVATVGIIKRRYLTHGLDAALYDKPRARTPAPVDETARAQITALACAGAPAGHPRWTLDLLADQAVKLGVVESISPTTVKAILKKPIFPRLANWCGAAER